MLVTEFIEQLNKINEAGANSAKEKFIADRIKRKYVPVAEKTGKFRVALNSSVISPENGVPYVDMMLNKIYYIYMVINLYTDIEVAGDDEGRLETLELYDGLKESKALPLILEAIGEDLSECLFVNEQVLDTWHLQNSSTRAFVSSVIKDFSGLSEAFATQLNEIVKTLPTSEDTK